MSVSEAVAGAAQGDAEPAALDITVGDAAARRLQPLPKPEGAAFGYLHAERNEPVACSWIELTDACRSGQAVLVWTPDTAQMVAPQQVPGLATAMLQADLGGARSRRLATLVLLAVAGAIALYFPNGWLFAAGAALIAWSANLRVRAAEARTADDVAWPVPGASSSSPGVRTPSPYTLSMGFAVAAAAVAQIVVLGRAWVEGMWIPDAEDGDWLRLLGDPMLHAESLSMMLSAIVFGGLGTALEKEAPRAYLPISFVAGVLATAAADALLPGSAGLGPVGGLMGMAGFYAVLAARHAGPDRSVFDWLTSPTTLVSGSAVVLAFSFALAPLSGAGLLAGIALGLLCIPRPGDMANGEELGGERWTEWMGLGALGLIWLSALAAIASLVLG
ncbi:MAG TPA: rhomboid family intramembrane serine protease [Longimicrobium sp.]